MRLTCAVIGLMGFISQAAGDTIDVAPDSLKNAETLKSNVEMIDHYGVCGAVYPLGDGKRLELTIRASDKNVALAVHNLPPEMVNAGLYKENVPVTLVFDDRAETTADMGMYRGRLTHRIVAYWDDRRRGLKALRQLKGVRSIKVVIENRLFGPATPSQPSRGWQFIHDCLARHGVDF